MDAEGPTEYGVFWEPSTSTARGPDWENANNYFKERDVSDWLRHFDSHPEIFLKILANIIQASAVQEARRVGEKPPRRVRPKEGILPTALPLIMPRYSMDPFPEALAELRSGRTESTIRFCKRVGIPRRTLDHMLSRKMPLSMYWMKRIADDFDVAPEFFKEYREMMILVAVHRYLDRQPAAGIWFVRTAKGRI